MRKIAGALFCAVTLALAGCGSSANNVSVANDSSQQEAVAKETEVSENLETESVERQESENETEISIEEQVVFEGNDIKITATGIEPMSVS